MNQPESTPSLQKLLAYKRLDMPSSAYFNGVVSEFHRRQRANFLQPKSTWSTWMESLSDIIFFQPARCLQMASVTCALITLTVVGLSHAWNSPTGDLFATHIPSISEEHYLVSNASETLATLELSPKLEMVASLQDSDLERAQYVLNEAPAAYDAVMAF